MNRFRMPARRALAVAAAAAIGAVGAVFLAVSPASAHYSTIEPEVSCKTSTGEWVIDWTVKSNFPVDSTRWKIWDVVATYMDTTGSHDSPDPIAETPKIQTPDVYPYSVNENATGTQTVPGSATSATLKVKSKWNDGTTENSYRIKTVDLDKDGCVKDHAQPSVTYESFCDGTIAVTFHNDGGTAPAFFTVDGRDGTTQVAPNANVEPITLPSGFGHVTVREGDGEVGHGYDWKKPEVCKAIAVSSKQDCSSLTVQLDNPDGPAADYSVVSGDKTVTGTLAPGASKTLDSFPAGPGTTAVVTIDNLAPTTITWTTQEACAPPDLPKTGSSLTPLASIGGALLVGGAGMIGLLFLLRRRRTTASG